MKKIIWIVVGLLGVWVFKLTLDMNTLNKIYIAELNSRISQQTQKIASLNDQLIAVQKSVQSESTQNTQAAPPVSSIEPRAYDNINYEKLIVKDRLDLIHILLQQQQFNAATEQIQRLKQKLIEEQAFAESINSALIEALSRDQNAINVYLQQRAKHQLILQQELQQIEQLLNPPPLASNAEKWQISSWLNISKAQGVPDFQQREFFYQQQKLKLLLAQQALYAGHLNFYHAELNQIQQELAAYPDSATQQILQRLKKLQNKQLIAPPTLSALALFEG